MHHKNKSVNWLFLIRRQVLSALLLFFPIPAYTAQFFNSPNASLQGCQNYIQSYNIFQSRGPGHCVFRAICDGTNDRVQQYVAQDINNTFGLASFFVYCNTYISNCKFPSTFDYKVGYCIDTQRDAGDSCTQDGNPCNAVNGNKFQTEQDYASATLDFTRYYNSQFEIDTAIGQHWSHSYSASLVIGSTIKAQRPDGKAFVFEIDNGTYIGPPDIVNTLVPSGTHWLYKNADDSVETYNQLGQLIEIKTRDGRKTTLDYLNGDLTTVTGPFNRQLLFSYNSLGQIASVTTPDNTRIHYGYDTQGNLKTVRYPDQTPADSTDNPTKTYHYEKPALIHHLTGISDENGQRYATWDYDSLGRAILSQHANAADTVTFDYVDDTTTRVTDALGRIKTYTFEKQFGHKKPSSISLHYLDGTTPVTKTLSYTYNIQGRVETVTDYNGNITYTKYNQRGLVNEVIRAQETVDQQKAKTTWHAQFQVPVQVDVYDPQDVLVKRTLYSYSPEGRLETTRVESP